MFLNICSYLLAFILNEYLVSFVFSKISTLLRYLFLDIIFLRVLKEYPEKTQSTLIQSTVENYLTYVYKITKPKLIHVIIQGVPCPNIDPDKVEINDLSKLINLIKEFNAVLSEKSTKIGFEFLDLHKLTDKGDGFSNGLWNIDAHHLSPTGMLEAWRRHLA